MKALSIAHRFLTGALIAVKVFLLPPIALIVPRLQLSLLSTIFLHGPSSSFLIGAPTAMTAFLVTHESLMGAHMAVKGILISFQLDNKVRVL